MLVLKFGGTSVGTAERMSKVADLVTHTPGKKVVVLSALSGTTNALVQISELLVQGNNEAITSKIDTLEDHYFKFSESLFTDSAFIAIGKEIVRRYFGLIRLLGAGAVGSYANGDRTIRELLAQGELIATELFHNYLNEQGWKARMFPALHFMSIDENEEPELEKISERLKPLLLSLEQEDILITQGFICRNHLNEIDNLKRGGSDYTASLIGAAIKAEEIQIWTDISGMHNNDPRIVRHTFPIASLSFEEASELAYFGAKILHPATIVPAQKHKIPVRLKNTMDELAEGTLISNLSTSGEVKAIAAKDNITAIKIKSSRMFLAYGFLRKVFEVFERHKTSIDMITTSEVAVSVTIDDDHSLSQICEDLKQFGIIEVDANQTIICIVGNRLSDKEDVLKKIFNAIGTVPIRMVSYGGSRNNISLLTETKHKETALNLLNEGLFADALK
ncbi:MAG: aspartate kinase [Cyclobacteriaceae bacterium]